MDEYERTVSKYGVGTESIVQVILSKLHKKKRIQRTTTARNMDLENTPDPNFDGCLRGLD